MATTRKLVVNEENLCCSICLELFVQPRILPCSHSFCQDCLIGYIKIVISKDQFNCPICRKLTELKTKVVAETDDCVDCFPLNVALANITEPRTMANVINVCFLCQREQVEAFPKYYCFECNEKLCGDCIKYHTKNKFLASHKLCNIEDKLGVTVELEFLNKMTKCKMHGSEDVRYLCQDHDELCCNECAIVKHRKCIDLVSISSELKHEDPKRVEDKISALERTVQTLYLHETIQKAIVEDSEKQAKQRLKDFQENIKHAISHLEQTVLSETEQLKKNLLLPIETNMSNIESLKASIIDLKKKIQTVHEFGQEIHKVLIERQLRDELNTLEMRRRELQNDASCGEISFGTLEDIIAKSVANLKTENIVKEVRKPLPKQIQGVIEARPGSELQIERFDLDNMRPMDNFVPPSLEQELEIEQLLADPFASLRVDHGKYGENEKKSTHKKSSQSDRDSHLQTQGKDNMKSNFKDGISKNQNQNQPETYRYSEVRVKSCIREKSVASDKVSMQIHQEKLDKCTESVLSSYKPVAAVGKGASLPLDAWIVQTAKTSVSNRAKTIEIEPKTVSGPLPHKRSLSRPLPPVPYQWRPFEEPVNSDT